MGIGKLKMAVHIPCLNVLVTAIMIMIVQVTLFVINVMSMSPSLDAVEENKMIQRQITASVDSFKIGVSPPLHSSSITQLGPSF